MIKLWFRLLCLFILEVLELSVQWELLICSHLSQIELWSPYNITSTRSSSYNNHSVSITNFNSYLSTPILNVHSLTGRPVVGVRFIQSLSITATGPHLLLKLLGSHSSVQLWTFRMRPEFLPLDRRRQVDLLGWKLSLCNTKLRIIVSLSLGIPTCVEHTYLCQQWEGKGT